MITLSAQINPELRDLQTFFVKNPLYKTELGFRHHYNHIHIKPLSKSCTLWLTKIAYETANA